MEKYNKWDKDEEEGYSENAEKTQGLQDEATSSTGLGGGLL
jgi:hypothetical protein